jgi:hypothetical protein
MACSLKGLRRIMKDLKRLSLASVVVAASYSPANADFLDDLFGGSDQAPHAAFQGRAVKRHYDTTPRERAPKRESRVRSEVQFMPVARSKGRTDHRERDLTNVAKTDDSASSAGSKPVVAALCAPESTIAGASAPILLAYDKTLRKGDILVSNSGVQVFRGHSACPHEARDFIALSSTNMPKGKRSMLLALEESMKHASGYSVTTKFDTH